MQTATNVKTDTASRLAELQRSIARVVKGKDEVIQLMDYHGDFGADSPEWKVQARLEDEIEAFCDSKFKKRPAKSTIQRHIKPWLADWRKAKT